MSTSGSRPNGRPNERAPRGLSITAGRHPQSRTGHAGRKVKSGWGVLALLVACAAPAGADTSRASWPPFLRPRLAYPPDVVAAVEHIWVEPTLTRTVRRRPAHVPFEVYGARATARSWTLPTSRRRRPASRKLAATRATPPPADG